MSEYWFFKDDPYRLYVKKQATKENMGSPVNAKEESLDIQDKPKYVWFFIDDEDQFDQLFDSLNLKGIREKKLLENLKKIRIVLKMKKGKKTKANEENGEEAKENQPEDADEKMADDDNEDLNCKEPEVKKDSHGTKHHLYANDDYEQIIINAVWFNKNMPKKRTNTRGGRGVTDVPDNVSITLE